MDESTGQTPPAVVLQAKWKRRKFRLPPPRVSGDAPAFPQEFFLTLALARRGKWNEWRAKHPRHAKPYFPVTFANVNFRTIENQRIDFSGFIFGDLANLSGATFRNRAYLSGTTFGDGANLCGATFGDWAYLSGTTFGDEADLYGATFGDGAKLIGATFGDRADLSGATFGDGADFSGATFGGEVDLSGATFGDGADFSGATFGDGVNFKGWSSDEWTKFRTELVKGPLSVVWQEDQKQAFLQWERRGLQSHGSGVARPDRFSSISFVRTRFRGIADFSGRQFGERADFSAARFDEPPRFDSMFNIDFYGAKIGFRGRVSGWTTRSDVASRLRNLRKLADDSKNHDLERDLYIEERKAERGIYFAGRLSGYWHQMRQRWYETTNVRSDPPVGLLPFFRQFAPFAFWQAVLTATRLMIHLSWIVAMFIYWSLADYGRSFVRPFIALVISIVLFHATYWLTLPPQPAPDFWPRVTAALSQAITWPKANDPPFVRATRAFALANAVPFVGTLTLDREIRERLICRDRPVDEKKAAEQGVLPCVPIPPLRFQTLALLQSIVSALCVFFIVLALRNYFRMR